MHSNPTLQAALTDQRFPRSSGYDAEWVADNAMGPHPLWLMEHLCGRMKLEPGMRVLDLGCGRAITSVFLAREFGVNVWAHDLWIHATDNWARIREAGAEDRVFPIHGDARQMPYAGEFFDAVVSVDAYQYFGTDDLYLSQFIKFVRPGGQLGIVVPGLTQPLPPGGVPVHLTTPAASGKVFWDPSECCCFHTAEWWERHWRQTGLVDIEYAGLLDEGAALWLKWLRGLEIIGLRWFDDDPQVIEEDGGEYIGFVTMTARRKEGG